MELTLSPEYINNFGVADHCMVAPFERDQSRLYNKLMSVCVVEAERADLYDLFSNPVFFNFDADNGNFKIFNE